MKFKYKNWLAALAATSILAGGFGVAEAAVSTKTADGTTYLTTDNADSDAAVLNMLTDTEGTIAAGSHSVAFGYQAEATGSRSMAFGQGAKATKENSMAFGRDAKATENFATALGNGSEASGGRAVAIAGGLAGGHTSVAIGAGATTSGDQEHSGAIAIGRWTESTNYNSMAVGSYAKASGSEASSFGAYADAQGELSTAIGAFAEAQGEYSVAIGDEAVASGADAIAIGYRSNAGGEFSLAAMGGITTGYDSVAIGWKAAAYEEGAYALGDGSYAGAENGIAFGAKARAEVANGVAIGSKSVANVSAGKTGVYVDNKGDSDPDYAWTSTAAAVAVGGTQYTVSDGKVVREDITRQITGVAAGTQLTDAVNVAQLQAVKTALENKIDNIQLTISGSDGNIKVNDKASDTKKVGDAETGTTGGTGESTKKGMEFDLTLADEITVDKVTAGDTTITTDGVTVGDSALKSDSLTVNGKTYITADGINANGKISGVADGTVAEGSTDAVNGGQLYTEQEARKAADDALSDRITQNSNAIAKNAANINKLGNRIDRVGAGAAALAALHPLDFDPDAKWDFAAGYGNYRGANAAAVGAFYRPNEDLMFSVGGSFGGGENMVNAGVSVKLGSGSDAPSSKAAMAAEIRGLRGTVAAQDEKLAAQDAQLAEQDARLAAQDEKIAELTRLVEQLAAKG